MKFTSPKPFTQNRSILTEGKFLLSQNAQRPLLLLKIGPWMRWTSTIELRRPGRRTMPWAYHSNPVAKVGTAETVIRNDTAASSRMTRYAARCANDASMHLSAQTHFLIWSNTGRSRSVSQERINVSSFQSGAV
jgi:hypothetical protein